MQKAPDTLNFLVSLVTIDDWLTDHFAIITCDKEACNRILEIVNYGAKLTDAFLFNNRSIIE